VRALLENGFSAVAYYDSAGRLVASGGRFAESAELSVPLERGVHTELLWHDGTFFVQHSIPIRSAGGIIGSMRSEQPMPILTRMSKTPLDLGRSEEMVLCARRKESFDCFPSQRRHAVFRAQPQDSEGAPSPVARAFAGPPGVVIVRDDSGRNVVAAYGPIGGVGLGIVVKVETSEIFHAMREELETVIGLLALLVAAGTLLLRAQVRPLATRLVDAQAEALKRSAALVDAVEAKDRFLATMSHELRTPLYAIIGFTGMLLLKLPGPLNPEQARQLGTVQSSARYLLTLINDMLDLAKIEAGKLDLDVEACACEEVVHEVAASLRPLANSKGLPIEVVVPSGSTVVQTDRRVVKQILLNLVGNAIKFTDAGHVGIRLERGDASEVRFAVGDTGPGIAAGDQGRLFSAFTQLDGTTRRRHEGTGLGLHLSRKLAEALGGRITLRSTVGAGSEFTLVLEGH
ncbi:MAG TPA: ATP-binding protein, partial [Usitatibacter sp.]